MINLSKYSFHVEHYGIHKCRPKHAFGPGVKTSFMIVHVLDGEGYFTINNVTRKLKKRDVFMVSPHIVHKYVADETNPWEYAWISFGCDDFIKDFDKIPSSMNVRQTRNVDMITKHIMRLERNEKYDETGYKLVRDDAVIKLFLSEMLSEDFDVVQNPKVTSVQRIKDYIQNNYFIDLSVEDVAKEFGYNRSYLCRLFKEIEHKSPKEYIIDYRMQIACQLFLESNLSVQNVSNSVGYRDSFNFSKMFKKKMGMAPQEYKKYIESTLKQYF